MARHHAAHTAAIKLITKRQWMRLGAGVTVIAAVIGIGFASRGFYSQPTAVASSDSTEISAYSATNMEGIEVSRDTVRKAISEGQGGATANTSYVTVSINGDSRIVLGENFTTVKSVLEAGNITLEPTDTVTPALDQPVDESTTITITRADATIETSDEEIPFNTVEKQDDTLAEGTTKVETEGVNGVVESTNLVTRNGSTVVSTSTIAKYVKTAPVDKVVLVGTKKAAAKSTGSSSSNSGSSSSASIGTTAPVGEMQQWAHDYLLSNGYSESDFTATVFIISHESGWQVNSSNPSSGAYGLPQALPGSKMAAFGDDWRTNYQTQLKWFFNYCNSRYGSIQGAYSFWLSHKWY
ncbi:G5 domain-containing protein [Bifidobacterium sp. DSM 109958]|uniref:G5 domain-containing protein n=1 Tax=Bifidobacterium moraviense TaxID=2675323 RepID=A0A7Y0HZ78_9BIFI|nr:G5 domain-containing protein [Bifidobacterium sp. DSM 109958]NMN00489.1 G5 domain-containing protein [Bifidobacterium sp. DSM 109958]